MRPRIVRDGDEMGRGVPVLVGLLLCLVAIGAGGCQGYSTKSLMPMPHARTIGVRPFTQTGWRRDVEMRLTQRVVEVLRKRGVWAIGDPLAADLVLEGNTQAVEDALALDENRVPIQKRLRGTTRIVLRERATGRIVREATVEDRVEFRPGVRGESLEGSATDAWTERMAERIVDALEEPF